MRLHRQVRSPALFVIMCLGVSGCDFGGEDDAASVGVDDSGAISSAQPERRRVLTDLMSFVGPEGWQMFGDRDPAMVRRFVDPEGDPERPNAVITIRRTRAESTDLAALAQKIADEWGGRVLDDEIELHRVPVRLIEAPHPGEGLHPVRGLVARTVMEQILIEVSVSPEYQADIEAPLQELLDDWRWMGRSGID